MEKLNVTAGNILEKRGGVISLDSIAFNFDGKRIHIKLNQYCITKREHTPIKIYKITLWWDEDIFINGLLYTHYIYLNRLEKLKRLLK